MPPTSTNSALSPPRRIFQKMNDFQGLHCKDAKVKRDTALSEYERCGPRALVLRNALLRRSTQTKSRFMICLRARSRISMRPVLTFASSRLGVRSLSVCRLGENSPFASTRARRLLGRLIVERNNEHRTLCPLEYSVGDTTRKQMIKRPAPVRSKHN
jgi:hypothetical protein